MKDRNNRKFSSLFLGFKVHCLGRFTRKQRATSYWFSRGTVPLNTIKSRVDYSYYTIPLRNSAITVKVWIHCSRGSGSSRYFKKIL